mmetsp:Transcript_6786/g.25071  ORF Transcript_6786/g.25071 Transcript_6786/m.25071 type:complete len:390 (-) Transcript_6786:251-1420(-)
MGHGLRSRGSGEGAPQDVQPLLVRLRSGLAPEGSDLLCAEPRDAWHVPVALKVQLQVLGLERGGVAVLGQDAAEGGDCFNKVVRELLQNLFNIRIELVVTVHLLDQALQGALLKYGRLMRLKHLRVRSRGILRRSLRSARSAPAGLAPGRSSAHVAPPGGSTRPFGGRAPTEGAVAGSTLRRRPCAAPGALSPSNRALLAGGRCLGHRRPLGRELKGRLLRRRAAHAHALLHLIGAPRARDATHVSHAVGWCVALLLRGVGGLLLRRRGVGCTIVRRLSGVVLLLVMRQLRRRSHRHLRVRHPEVRCATVLVRVAGVVLVVWWRRLVGHGRRAKLMLMWVMLLTGMVLLRMPLRLCVLLRTHLRHIREVAGGLRTPTPHTASWPAPSEW